MAELLGTAPPTTHAQLLRDVAVTLANNDLEAIDWSKYNQQAEQIAQESQHVAAHRVKKDLGGPKAVSTVSGFVKNFLTVDREPFDFTGREYLYGVYDLRKQYPMGCRNVLMLAGRQVEKSTSQAAKSISLAAMYKAYKTLYIAPRWDQVSVFSTQRFRAMCEDSPDMGLWVQPSKTLWQVSSREFTNGAFFNFRSCYLSADNARGITCEHLLVDEIQDIVSDAIEVLEECQSHAKDHRKFRLYAGTPKTTSNLISRTWTRTSQFEWLIKCSACNHWNYPDDEIVADDAYRCTRCRKEIEPRNGKWVPSQPSYLDHRWGFRIPQLIVPFQSHAKVKAKREEYSARRYFNEVLGLPYDEGQLVLTESVMRNACEEREMSQFRAIREIANRGVPVFAGIDYGSGEGDNPSYTVITIGHRDKQGVFHVLYMKKFTGTEVNLSKQVGALNEIMTQCNVRWCGADWGFGAAQNARLVDELGWNWYGAERLLMQMQYVQQGLLAKWRPDAERYSIDRNQMIELIVDKIRTGKTRFFNFMDLKPFVSDFTGIYIEFDERRNTYKYDHEVPDDAFHSLAYAEAACMQYYGELTTTLLPNLP